MARGRKALPGKIHQLRGTHREDRHGGELEVESILPDPPERLVGDELEEWHKMAPELHKVGVLTALDVTCLEMYCVVFGQWLESRRQIASRQDGMIATTPNGFKQQSVWYQIERDAAKRMQGLLAEFGMTPATRARLKLIKQKPKQLDLLTLLDELSVAKAKEHHG